MMIADVDSDREVSERVLLFTAGSTAPYQAIAGPKPSLKVPGGVALDTNNRFT